MAVHEKRFELIKTYKERQDKFAYYVMGLCVASIAFSLSKTFDSRLNFNHIYLGVAILCWFISIIAAIRWILIQLYIMELNLALSDVIGGHHNFAPINEATKKRLLDNMKGKLEIRNIRSGHSYKVMLVMFLFGVGAFITWRIIEML